MTDVCTCLLAVQTEPKKKLTPEEAAQQAEELRKRIKAKNQVLPCQPEVACLWTHCLGMEAVFTLSPYFTHA